MNTEPIVDVYDHALLINLSSIPEQEPLYSCDYTFLFKDYKLCIYPDGACVHKYTKAKECPWKFDPVARDVRDALRKAYIIYVLRNGKGLKINRITILCDGKKLRTIDDSTPGFPYAFSMLGDKKLATDDEMSGTSGVFGNHVCMDYITNSKRSGDQNDKKIIALFSFLQGRSREYETDRFLNYWTAINAIYGYLCTEHANVTLKHLDKIPETILEKYQIDREDLKSLFIPFDARNDHQQINTFRNLIMMETGIKKSKGGSGSKVEILKRINNDYANPYKYFFTKYTDEDGKPRYSFEKLYERVIGNEAIENMTFSNDNEKEAYNKLTEWGIQGAGSLYAFLSIDEPYYMRNYYIHGSETPLLVSDAYHLELLSCLNYFMDKLLVRYIPALYVDTERQRLIDKVHGIIYSMEKSNKSELAKKAGKMARELGQKDHVWMMGQAF